MPEASSSVSKNSVVIAIGVVVVTAVMGVIARPDIAVQVLGFCTTVVVSLLAILRVESNAEAQARRSEEVKSAASVAAASANRAALLTERKLGELQATAELTKNSVDDTLGNTLRAVAELSSWKAQREPNEVNLTAAKMALAALKAHEERRVALDTNGGGKAQ